MLSLEQLDATYRSKPPCLRLFVLAFAVDACSYRQEKRILPAASCHACNCSPTPPTRLQHLHVVLTPTNANKGTCLHQLQRALCPSPRQARYSSHHMVRVLHQLSPYPGLSNRKKPTPTCSICTLCWPPASKAFLLCTDCSLSSRPISVRRVQILSITSGSPNSRWNWLARTLLP